MHKDGELYGMLMEMKIIDGNENMNVGGDAYDVDKLPNAKDVASNHYALYLKE